MRAFLARLRSQLSWGIVGATVAPVLAAVLFPDTFGETDTPWWLSLEVRSGLVGMVLLVSGTSVLRKYRRSSLATLLDVDAEELEQLRSGSRYCLLLRSFRDDGRVLIRRRFRRGHYWRHTPFNDPKVAAEELLTAAARNAVGLETVAVVDQSAFLAPPGPVYYRASDAAWRPVVDRLIASSQVVVLLLGSAVRTAGAGLEWEVHRIGQRGADARMMILLPPIDRRRPDIRRAAIAGAVDLVDIMRTAAPTATSPGLGPPRVDPEQARLALAITYTRASGVRYWIAGSSGPFDGHYDTDTRTPGMKYAWATDEAYEFVLARALRFLCPPDSPTVDLS